MLMHQFFGKIGSPVFLFEEYPSEAYLFSPNYWAADLSRRANGILVFFEFCSSLISYTYFIGFNMT